MARMDDVRTATAVTEPGQAPRAGTSPVDFESFFLAHHLRLFRALWLMTRNRHEAEEVMQDAFLRVWERWDRVATLPDPDSVQEAKFETLNSSAQFATPATVILASSLKV